MITRQNHVIVVNEQDEWVGTMEKLQAHKEGILHRAFSVFIFNDNNEMLLQQRSTSKYHSPGLWSNSCCSHPLPGESTMDGAHRRLQEELGFDCALEPLFHLRYRSDVGNDLIENEYDHIYLGQYAGAVVANPAEVSDVRFVAMAELSGWMSSRPEDFTKWFLLAMPELRNRLKDSFRGVL